MSIYIETSKFSKLEKPATKTYQADKTACSKIAIQNEGNNVVKIVSEISKIPVELFFHRSRCKSQIADARQLAMYLLHVVVGKSMSEVGRFFGRDRTTVSHACTIIEDRRDDIKFETMVCQLEDRLEDILFETTMTRDANEQKTQH